MIKSKWKLFLTLNKHIDARAEQILNEFIACVSGRDKLSNGMHDGKLGYHVRENLIITTQGGIGSLDSHEQDTDRIEVRVLDGSQRCLNYYLRMLMLVARTNRNRLSCSDYFLKMII